MDLRQCNETLRDFALLIAEQRCGEWQGELKTGVDLGTTNIVLAVADEAGRPVAGISYPSVVVRDGIVVDYVGAVRVVRELKARLESMLGRRLERAACAIPPGILPGNAQAIGNVVKAADFMLTNIVDEPTAAAAVLGLNSGAVVDVGGGTTGISILQEGQVIFSGDQPTGGHHMSLVLAGAMGCSLEEAEAYKTDPTREADVFPVIRPVIDKMAAIVKNYLCGYEVETVYVVGGACSFTLFAQVFADNIGLPVIKPAEPLLVTPLGIALNCLL